MEPLILETQKCKIAYNFCKIVTDIHLMKEKCDRMLIWSCSVFQDAMGCQRTTVCQAQLVHAQRCRGFVRLVALVWKIPLVNSVPISVSDFVYTGVLLLKRGSSKF